MPTGESVDIRNRLLLALPPDIRADLIRECDHVELANGQVIYPSGAPMEEAYFINSGLVSLVKTMADGRSVEVGAVGAEGLVGAFGAYGISTAIADYVVQVPAVTSRISRISLHNKLSEHAALQRVIAGYIFLLARQLAQTAACNRLHSLQQRCCQWLLVAHDNAFSDNFVLVHEFLALLLGAQRPSVSVACHKLQQRGLIRYVHGRVTILDRAGLERSACECYGANRAQIDAFFDPAFLAKSA